MQASDKVKDGGPHEDSVASTPFGPSVPGRPSVRQIRRTSPVGWGLRLTYPQTLVNTCSCSNQFHPMIRWDGRSHGPTSRGDGCRGSGPVLYAEIRAKVRVHHDQHQHESVLPTMGGN